MIFHYDVGCNLLNDVKGRLLRHTIDEFLMQKLHETRSIVCVGREGTVEDAEFRVPPGLSKPNSLSKDALDAKKKIF